MSASAEEQRAWLAACDRAKAANETLSRAGDIADYGSEQAAQDTRGLAAARYAEVRQVYNHLYDPAHYATIEGDGGKEDAYCDSVWERAESLVDLGYTATSLVGLDAAHAEAEQEAWPVSADQRLADEQHHRGYDDWRTEQTIDELRMQIGAARQDLESGVVPAEREHEHAEHVEYLEEQLAVAEGAPHDEVYPATPLDAAAVDEPWVPGEQWYARSSEERQRVLDRAAAITGSGSPRGHQEELADVLHDELADALDQVRARLEAGDVPEVGRSAHEARIEQLEAELAGEESVPAELARSGDPVLAAKTEAWMTTEAIATERWLNDEEACREGENTTTAQDPDTGHAKDC
ncbi:MAG: hypothetical protein ACREQ5_36010, partial [Candidatus Dormibacteria bacterium]